MRTFDSYCAIIYVNLFVCVNVTSSLLKRFENKVVIWLNIIYLSDYYTTKHLHPVFKPESLLNLPFIDHKCVIAPPPVYLVLLQPPKELSERPPMWALLNVSPVKRDFFLPLLLVRSSGSLHVLLLDLISRLMNNVNELWEPLGGRSNFCVQPSGHRWANNLQQQPPEVARDPFIYCILLGYLRYRFFFFFKRKNIILKAKWV